MNKIFSLVPLHMRNPFSKPNTLNKKVIVFLVYTSFLSLKGDEKNLYFEIGMKSYLFFPFLSEKTTISGVLAFSFDS